MSALTVSLALRFKELVSRRHGLYLRILKTLQLRLFLSSDCDAGKVTTGLVHPQSGLGISPKLILGGASRNLDPSTKSSSSLEDQQQFSP